MSNIILNEAVPHFTGKTTNGVFDFNTMRGKNIVLYFYPKDNTPGCTLESKAFRDHHAKFQAQNTEIIGVSRDSLQSHCTFIDNHGLNFLLISDDNESLCQLFNVLKEKSLFGKKYTGIERSTFLIDQDGILKYEWRDVSVMGHVKDVLEKATELNQKQK